MESKGHSCGKRCKGHLEEALPTVLAALLAIPHFEIEWDGFLPASADGIAGYRADHARTQYRMRQLDIRRARYEIVMPMFWRKFYESRPTLRRRIPTAWRLASMATTSTR
ncbi:hypothetical protein [Ralstonia solanacearum]|uniref:hypothetical protein n=1 Tax=Ralstonia solanacearum TaxID=305 RepID=UPI000E57C9B7|nr:hypothetical protein [Ralstonia solanacearum]AXW08231.1 hypothetical protein CJO82_20535 [Ralstonia solanacearum]AXW26021.1 hypothetical protein CJO86_20800 [Ralstonia solanacearum]AXW82931.1 hypothetical protein CJO98_20895 [Ralstonia solanacearum]